MLVSAQIMFAQVYTQALFLAEAPVFILERYIGRMDEILNKKYGNQTSENVYAMDLFQGKVAG